MSTTLQPPGNLWKPFPRCPEAYYFQALDWCTFRLRQVDNFGLVTGSGWFLDLTLYQVVRLWDGDVAIFYDWDTSTHGRIRHSYAFWRNKDKEIQGWYPTWEAAEKACLDVLVKWLEEEPGL